MTLFTAMPGMHYMYSVCNAIAFDHPSFHSGLISELGLYSRGRGNRKNEALQERPGEYSYGLVHLAFGWPGLCSATRGALRGTDSLTILPDQQWL